MQHDLIGGQGQGLFQSRNRLLMPPHGIQDGAEIVQGVNMIRGQLQRFACCGQGFFVAFQLFEDAAQIEVGLHHGRTQLDGTAAALQRSVQITGSGPAP